ncbi:MAG: AbrB family transcriptional regulator, partial [Staphylococcus hominis]
MRRIWLNNIILLIIAMIMSLILKLSHMLLPFMFGPIIASIIVVKVLKLNIKWPFWISQIGLILLGVQIGSTFTSQVINDI